MILNRFSTLVLTSFLLSIAAIAQASDRNGNYTTADFFPTRDEYALATWKVVAGRLNCRKRPGLNQPIVHVFKQNDPLSAQTSEGSRSNVGFLQMDAQGLPWMRVFQPSGSHPTLASCFVRANRAYIAPVIEQR